MIVNLSLHKEDYYKFFNVCLFDYSAFAVRNRCVIDVFGGVCVLSFGFRIFCWYRGVLS